MTNHVAQLMNRHRELDARLRAALAQRGADPREIARLKKLKLAIKDRLASLLRGPAQAA